jgi:hypothetical protein
MKIYTSVKQIPEFKDMSRWELFKVSRLYYVKSFLHWGPWLGLSLLVACIFIWYWIVEGILPSILHMPTPENISILLLAFWSAFGGSIYFQFVAHTIRYLYRRDKNITTA